MKVLHVMYAAVPEYGGPFTSLVGFVEASAAVGIETEVFSTDAFGSSDAGLVAGGVRYHRSFFGRFPVAPGMRRAITESARSADLVHIHGLWRTHTLAGAAAARACGIPYVLRTCGHLSPEPFSHNSWMKRLYFHAVESRVVRGAARLHATTEMEREASRWLTGDLPMEVLPPPVSSLERLDSVEARRRVGIAAETPLVVTVGRLDPIKRHDVLIDALTKLPGSVQLAIVGADEREHGAALALRAAEAGLSERVRFVGHASRSDLAAWLAAADLFVSVSEHENFGMAIAEAAMTGAPMLIPRNLAIAGVFSSSAAILDSREPGAVAAAIAEQLGNERRWEQAERSREVARGLWSPEAIGARLKSFYEEVCASSPAGTASGGGSA